MARTKVQIKDKKTGEVYESMYAAGKALAKALGGVKKGYDPESRLVWFSIARDHTDRFEYKDDSTKGKWKPLADRTAVKAEKKAKPEAAAKKGKGKPAKDEDEEEEDDDEEEDDEDEEDDEEEDDDSDEDEDDEDEEEEPPAKKSKKLAPTMKAGKGGKPVTAAAAKGKSKK